MDEYIKKIESLGACSTAVNFMREKLTPESAESWFKNEDISAWVEWLHTALTGKDVHCGKNDCDVCAACATKLLTFEQMMQCLECEWRS